jgi:hypothetical protein
MIQEMHRSTLDCIARLCGSVQQRQLQNVNIEHRTHDDNVLEHLRWQREQRDAEK